MIYDTAMYVYLMWRTTIALSKNLSVVFATSLIIIPCLPILVLFSAEKLRKLKDLLLKSDNRICADCGAVDPKWA